MKVEFFRHNLDNADIQNVEKVLRGLFLTTGETVKEFEAKFAQYLQVNYAIGVTSCTAALHLSLLAAGVQPGDEVITTPMSFIATANAIEYTGAKPVFVDIEPDTGNIDATKIENSITLKTKAIIPVHLCGQLCDMKRIREIADRHGLSVIEDAAHAVEAEREEYRSGSYGDFACFSFYATKNLTSGEGGAIVVKNEEDAELLKKLRLHGMSKNAADRYAKKYEHYDMEMLGWKYNMTNIQAAMMLHQLTRLEERLALREELCLRYEEAFSEIPGIRLIKTLPNVKSARHLFTILVAPERRDEIIHNLQEQGIGVAVNFRPIHLMKYYQKKYGYQHGSFPIAEDMGERTITLPLYPNLTAEEQEYVIEAVRKAV